MGTRDGIDAMNTKFPGLPDYQGPTEGDFSLLHHEELVEHSHDVMERIRYIDANKPASEVAIRRAHIVHLDPAEVPAVLKRTALDDEIVAYIRPLIKDWRWNGERLIF